MSLPHDKGQASLSYQSHPFPLPSMTFSSTQYAPPQNPGFVTLLLLFSSFFLPSYARIIIVPTGDQSLLLVFSWCFVRAVAPVDVFLMHPWREINSMSFYFSATLIFHNNVVLFLTSMISSSRIRKYRGKTQQIFFNCTKLVEKGNLVMEFYVCAVLIFECIDLYALNEP